MKFVMSTGGREKYFKGKTGDCVCRAICNATGKDYLEVYNALNELAKHEHKGTRKRGISSARTGVYKDTFKKYLISLGWVWHSTMQIGKGCQCHLNEEELPSGTLIVSLSKHLTCVKNGVIYDTYNCSIKQYYDENGDLITNDNRCVYGYFSKA